MLSQGSVAGSSNTASTTHWKDADQKYKTPQSASCGGSSPLSPLNIEGKEIPLGRGKGHNGTWVAAHACTFAVCILRGVLCLRVGVGFGLRAHFMNLPWERCGAHLHAKSDPTSESALPQTCWTKQVSNGGPQNFRIRCKGCNMWYACLQQQTLRNPVPSTNISAESQAP